MLNIRKSTHEGMWVVALAAAVLTLVGTGIAYATPSADSPSQTRPTPAGVALNPGGPANAQQKPHLPTNAKGQSYGSIADVSLPADEPDLILAQATNGKTGYVYRSELEAAEGANVASPEQAVQWQAQKDAQKAAGHGATVLTVYASDGMTKVGVFVVGP